MPNELKANLDHFIDQGKWPVRVVEAEAKLIKKYLPFLKVIKLKGKDAKYYEFVGKQKRNRNYEVTLTTKGVPVEVLAEYWQFRYEEKREMYEELYSKIKGLADNY